MIDACFINAKFWGNCTTPNGVDASKNPIFLVLIQHELWIIIFWHIPDIVGTIHVLVNKIPTCIQVSIDILHLICC